MNLQAHRLQQKHPQPKLTLVILSAALILTAILVFLYFFIAGNFHIHFIVALGSFWLLVCGISIALIAYLYGSAKSVEINHEIALKQMRRWSWLSMAGFYLSSLCLFAGLMFFAQSGEAWRNSIPLFAVSVQALIVSLFGLLQRTNIKHHYELKMHQQEIIDVLNSMSREKSKELSGGALLA